jgi:zinc and cadmium transporter
MNNGGVRPRMDPIWVAALASVFIVSLLSFVGALTLVWAGAARHTFMIGLVALAAGALLGDAFFHILPEAVELTGGFGVGLGVSLLSGFLIFFLLEAGLRWGHAHGESHHDHAGKSIEPFGFLNLVGDGVHNFIDGVLIGASFLVDTSLGVATTIAVALHELPQELGDFGVLLRSGFTPRRALAYNFGSALLAVLGTVLTLLLPVPIELLEAYGMPLIAGGFIYIAAADLVPELHHHNEHRFVPIVYFGMVLGMLSMLGLLLLEG